MVNFVSPLRQVRAAGKDSIRAQVVGARSQFLAFFFPFEMRTN